jgi:multiple sugar transport system permease protein
MDGCSVWKRYWSLYIPNSMPLLVSLGTLKLTYTWNDYIWPLVITQSERIMTVQLGLALFKDEIMQWEQLMAITTAVMLPIVLFFLFAQKYFVSGVLTSGMKG